ncbi:MAG: GIY-YIG nuclease family protein [Opitutae bacterium]|nr:GIY-YIG nuclease family protein [Opitutae bacterium]
MAAAPSHRSYWVYMLASKPSGTLYAGVTNSLQRRVWEHKNGMIPSFTKQYRVKTLVHFETYRDAVDAIRREKELKGWLRAKKIELIRQQNPLRQDLASDWNLLPMDSSPRSE